MRYINAIISEARSVLTEKSQLKITDKHGEIFTYPLEDISSIVLETSQCIISTHTLSQFSENGIACFTCDKTHTPNGILMPYNTHFNKPKVVKLQLDAPKPLQKRTARRPLFTINTVK